MSIQRAIKGRAMTLRPEECLIYFRNSKVECYWNWWEADCVGHVK